MHFILIEFNCDFDFRGSTHTSSSLAHCNLSASALEWGLPLINITNNQFKYFVKNNFSVSLKLEIKMRLPCQS